MKITRIGLDLAKNVFQVFGVDAQDKRVLSRQLKRKEMQAFFQALPACLIGMEACASAHYWAWVLTEMGHTVKLIAPQFVKPYVKGNKNDANDAEAICEAVSQPGMRFVPVKTIEQLHLQARHRVRSELIKQRTAKANQIRGLLAEYGIVIGLGVRCLRHRLPEILEETENRLQEDFRTLLAGLRDDLVYLDERIKTEDKAIETLANAHPSARRLQQLRGVGPVVATALIAALGDGRQFRNGRQASAWAGLVPGQHSSGGKQTLLGISKRGDTYLRTLLIHGARAALRAAHTKTDPLSLWLQGLCARRNPNVAAVALANKTMRLAWVLLRREEDYDPLHGHARPPQPT